jgi:hypothetical protein
MKRMFGGAAAATETNKRQQSWQRGFMVEEMNTDSPSMTQKVVRRPSGYAEKFVRIGSRSVMQAF